MLNRTQRDIVNAFNRLITKNDMEKITTQMIAREAGISKATFYRCFRDKYDVLTSNYKEVLDGYLKKCNNYRDLFFYLYTFFRDEWGNCHRAFRTTGVNSFENYIYTYSKTIVEEITAQNRGGQGLTVEEELQLDVFCYGCSYMLKKWTLGEYFIDCDMAADCLYAIMPEPLKHDWFLEQPE